MQPRCTRIRARRVTNCARIVRIVKNARTANHVLRVRLVKAAMSARAVMIARHHAVIVENVEAAASAALSVTAVKTNRCVKISSVKRHPRRHPCLKVRFRKPFRH